MLKRINDYKEVINILPTIVATSFVNLERNKLIQINLTTFIRCINNDKHVPENEKHNILILRGGISWFNCSAYYLKSVSSYFTEHVRVFVLEKYDPMVDMNFTDDIIDAMNYIRQHYAGRLVVIGYSMGAVLLSAYLAKTEARDADLFILCCNSFNIREFREVLNTHSLFQWIQKKDLAVFGAKTLEELMEKQGVNIKQQEHFMDHLISNLNKTHKKWHSKTLYVISEKDPITLNYKEAMSKFEKRPYTILCRGAWHCCSKVVASTFELAYDFFDVSDQIGKNSKVKDFLKSNSSS